MNLARAQSARYVARAIAEYARDHLGFRRAAVITNVNDGWLAVVAPPDGGDIVAGPCPPPNGTDLAPGPDGWRLTKTLEPGGTLATVLPDAAGVAIVPVEVDGTHLGVMAANGPATIVTASLLSRSAPWGKPRATPRSRSAISPCCRRSRSWPPSIH